MINGTPHPPTPSPHRMSSRMIARETSLYCTSGYLHWTWDRDQTWVCFAESSTLSNEWLQFFIVRRFVLFKCCLYRAQVQTTEPRKLLIQSTTSLLKLFLENFATHRLISNLSTLVPDFLNTCSCSSLNWMMTWQIQSFSPTTSKSIHQIPPHLVSSSQLKHISHNSPGQ